MAKYLSSYLPSSIVSYVADAPTTTMEEPLCQTYETVVIFADVSGYTAMCEAIAAIGKGAEEHLAKNLNSYFELLLKSMSSSGGDVFKFAGDAILVVWPPGPEDLPTKVRRAIQCGMNISSSFQDAQLSHGVRLSVKIGIGCGNVSILHLGGLYKRLEYLAVGEPLVQAFGAEGHATKTELIVSPFAWSMVKEHFEAILTEGDGYAIVTGRKGGPLKAVSIANRNRGFGDESEGFTERIGSYIPQAIVPFASLNDDKWINEIRSITVLFVNLGVGEDDLVNMTTPKDYMRIHRILRAVQTCIGCFEGSLNKFLMDDKGSTLLAAFGLPPHAHNNDPIRGVLCALQIIQSLKDLDLRASVGITTGTAFCGVVGGRGRREYSVLGDTVNLSARLMQHAKTTGAGVIIDRETREACLRNMTLFHQLFFTEIGVIKVKGKSKPVNIYQPKVKKAIPIAQALQKQIDTQRAQNPNFDADSERLLGDDKALARNLAQLKDIMTGSSGPTCVLVETLPVANQNINKSLFAHSPNIPEDCGCYLIRGAADPLNKHDKGLVWRQVVMQMFDDCKIVNHREWVREELGKAIPSLTEFLSCVDGVLRLDFEGEEVVECLSEEERDKHTIEILKFILSELLKLTMKAKERRVVIQFNDGECMDWFSWSIAVEVAQAIDVLLIIQHTRMDNTGSAEGYYELLKVKTTRRLQLMAREEHYVVIAAQEALGVREAEFNLPAALTHLIHRKAKGNPFVAQELVVYLVEEGLMTIDSTQKIHIKSSLCPPDHISHLKRLTDPKSLATPLPVSLYSLVSSRMDRMTLTQQTILKTGAIIGDRFSFELMKAIYPLKTNDAELEEAASVLKDEDVLMTSLIDPDMCEFSSGIMRDVILSRMLETHQTFFLNKLKMKCEEYRVDGHELAEDGDEKRFSDSVIEGFLEKEGKGAAFRKWKKKYVVLTAQKLFYYDSLDFSKGPKSEMMMSSNAEVQRLDDKDVHNGFSVTLGEARNLNFHATTPEECTRWYNKIKMILDSIKKQARDHHGTTTQQKSSLSNNLAIPGASGRKKEYRYSKIHLELSATSLIPKIYEESKMEGFMMKRKDQKMWRKRYFILMNGRLSYYEDNKSIKRMKGEIVLSPATEVGLDEDNDEKKTFYVQSAPDGKKMFFAATSPNEASNWMSEIKEMANNQAKVASAKMVNHSVKEGFLRKQGGMMGNWRRRYFVLLTRQLKYFTEDRQTKTGEMELFRESKVVADPNNPLLFTVLPIDGAKKYILEASSLDEREKWVKIIQAQLLIAPMHASMNRKSATE